jgi:hypothetical protein
MDSGFRPVGHCGFPVSIGHSEVRLVKLASLVPMSVFSLEKNSRLRHSRIRHEGWVTGFFVLGKLLSSMYPFYSPQPIQPETMNLNSTTLLRNVNRLFLVLALTAGALIWQAEKAFGQCFSCDNIIDVAGGSASGNVSMGCDPEVGGPNTGCQGYRINGTTTPTLVPGARLYFETGNGGACSTGGMSSVYLEVDGDCTAPPTGVGEISTSGGYTGFFDVPLGATQVIIYVCRSTGGGNPNLCSITQCGVNPALTSVTDETCIGANDGTITATGVLQGNVSGVLTFSIDGVGGATANTTGIFTGLAPGMYTVTAYDSGNPSCFGTLDVTVGAGVTACCTPPATVIIARAWCDDGSMDADEFQYFIQISGAAPASVNYTISWDSDSEPYTGGTIYIGPFNHSMTGGAVQVLDIADNSNPGCESAIEVLEAVCGFPQSQSFCDCSLNDPPGSLPAGAILAQSIPGTFEAGGSSGRIQKYILADPVTGEILEVNMTGLFTGLANGSYKVYAFNYRVEDAAIIENYLLPGQFYSVIEDGINGVGPLASVCYAVCTSNAANYTVDCDNDLNACNAMLMECPTVFSGNEAIFTLTDANDDAACGDATGLTISYHISQMDAMMDMSPLASPYTSGTIDLWVRVENADGCYKLALLQLVVKDSPAVDMTGTTASCAADPDGSVTATVTSGPANFTYNWSNSFNEGPTASPTSTINNVAPGTYTVSVTDGNGCTTAGTFTVLANDEEAPEITCPADITDVNDPGLCGAEVTFNNPVVTDNCPLNTTPGVVNFVFSGAIESWIVPPGVTEITIEARGAQGGSTTINCANPGGEGAIIEGTFAVTPGEVLNILVGEQGYSNGADGGGGGGSFVVRTGNVLLIAAGGGGGATNNIGQCSGGFLAGLDASITTSGTASGDGLAAGGTGGNGGTIFGGGGGGAGAGFLTNGAFNYCGPGAQSYLNGGAGGAGCSSDAGGFGGGGHGWFVGGGGGGAGGYSGGGNSSTYPYSGGGGGGSFNSGTNPVAIVGNTGNGLVIISYGTNSLAQTAGLPSGSLFPVGTTTNTFVITDESGNTASCSFNVTVTDNEIPAIDCPVNDVALTSDGGTGDCQGEYSWDIPIPMDNCGVTNYTVAYTNPDGTIDGPHIVFPYTPGNNANMAGGAPVANRNFSKGITLVTYYIEDAAGNTNSCSFTVTVTDDEDPTWVNCPQGEIFTISADPDCSNGVIWSIPVADDNCAVTSLTETSAGGPYHGNPLTPGTYNIEYTAADAAGNSATCSFTVVVDDDANPLLVCQDDMTVDTDPGVCSWTVPAGALNPLLAVDNCPGYTLTHSINGGAPANGVVPPNTLLGLGANTIAYTLTDAANNTVTCSFTVTVIDNEAPVIAGCPDDPAPTCGAGPVSWTPRRLPTIAVYPALLLPTTQALYSPSARRK